MIKPIRFSFFAIVLTILVFSACTGGSYDGDTNSPSSPDDLSSSGDLQNCFNEELYAIGSTYSISYEVQKHTESGGTIWYQSDMFQITETHTVLGQASFNGVDNAIEVAISVHPDTTASGGEHEEFDDAYKAYYVLNDDVPDDPRVEYLGSTKRNTGTSAYEIWQTAVPAEQFRFALPEGESFTQNFTMTTDSVAMDKTVVIGFEGDVTSTVPAGNIGACMVGGTGFAPLVYKTTESTAFTLHLAKDIGIPVLIEFTEGPTNWGMDPVVHMEMVSATVNGTKVF